MDELASRYDELAAQERTLFQQISTAELSLSALFNYIFQYVDVTNKLIVEDIMSAVHQIELDLRTEMLHLRLEKAIVSCELKKYH